MHICTQECIPLLSSSVVVMDNLVFRVSRESCMDDVYERFPLMNEVRLTFKNLCSIRKAYQCIDWKDQLARHREQNCRMESSACLWNLLIVQDI